MTFQAVERKKISHFQVVDNSYKDSDLAKMQMELSRYSEKV